jgi:3-oxoacyl-[acyl-carrier protein] reductase
MRNTNNKVIIITGGSKGIGLASVKSFLQKGCIVHTNSRTVNSEIQELKIRYEQTFFHSPLDVRNIAECKEFVADVINRHCKIDVLINNVGMGDSHMINEVSEDVFDKAFFTNFKPTYFFSQQVLRTMIPKRNGRIINISSIMAIKGYSGGTLYSASKAALHGFTISLAKEVGGRGITVNAILPGFVDTDMTSDFTVEQKQKIINRTPAKRLVTKEDIVAAINFLASDAASAINGQCLVVDGGLTC